MPEDTGALPFIHRMELLTETEWSSATFIGVRARLLLSYASVSKDESIRLKHRIAATDFAIGTHLIADLMMESRHGGMLVEALLLEVH